MWQHDLRERSIGGGLCKDMTHLLGASYSTIGGEGQEEIIFT